jgi:superfamily II DNA/RNA helicase
VNIDVGNDQPKVSIIVRAIQHPLNSYVDLEFTLKNLVDDPTQIPKTFIYCDNIAMGTEIIDHLMKLLPEDLCYNELIRPYNACFSKTNRKTVMRKFKEGEIQMLVCTDVAGVVSALLLKLMSYMAVMYQILISSFNGSSQVLYLHSFREPEGPLGQQATQGLQCCLQSHLHIQQCWMNVEQR